MAQSHSQANQQLAKDEIVLLRIFPAEVWNMIFTKCNSESSLALCATSACFKNWLVSRKTVYLFPQVWNVVKNTYINIHEHEIQRKMEERALDYFQHFLAYLPDIEETRVQPRVPNPLLALLTSTNNRTLKYRLVCKGWREAIDSVNLKEIDNVKMNPRKYYSTQDIQKWVYNQETEIHPAFNFEGFEQMVLGKNCAKINNFVRAVVITGWSSEVLNLLERIGSNVWYCTIKTDDRSFSRDVVYKNIRDTLNLLPNLKTLEIENANVLIEGNPDPVVDNQVPQLVGEKPEMKLEKLEILISRNLSFPLFTKMVQSNSHITTLHVVRTRTCGEYDIGAVPLPNLGELSFQIFTNTELEALCQACVTSLKTAKLFLIIEEESELNWTKLTELFQKILKDNFVTLVVDGTKLEGLGSEVAEKLQELRPRPRCKCKGQ